MQGGTMGTCKVPMVPPCILFANASVACARESAP